MTKGATWPILAVAIGTETDVVAVRQRARRIAELLGFEAQGQTGIATAVSEIARNALGHGGGGRAEFLLDAEAGPQVFLIRVSDNGPGIASLDAILDGRTRLPPGSGHGLVGARRLMERFRIESQPGRGTMVELGQTLPKRAPQVTRALLASYVAHLARERAAADPMVAMREQNRALLQSFEELGRRQAEAEQLNRELADTNRGVVALYAELDQKAEELRRASEAKSRFLSNMSHEFRTPLNSILALAQLLADRADGDLTPEQDRQVGYIRRSAEGLLDLVNDLLDIAKVEAGKLELRPAFFSVEELFGGLRGVLKPLQSNPAVDLVFEAGADQAPLMTDQGKVAQIVRNLVSNALKFTRAGVVNVSARPTLEGDTIEIAVRDTGIGIAPEDQARIFEEFAQADSPMQRGVKGTGLGLPLSRKLADLLGGEIRLESELGRGSTFTLRIPRTLGTMPEDSGADRVGARPKRVLVIDDDATFRYVMRQIVTGEGGYELTEAADGEQGLAQLRHERPDVVVVDLHMPGLDGFAVLRAIRQDPAIKETPAIVATSAVVTPELRAGLPERVPILSKHAISRQHVSSLLRAATQAESFV